MQAHQGIKHSKQQCRRYRANTVTANSKASLPTCNKRGTAIRTVNNVFAYLASHHHTCAMGDDDTGINATIEDGSSIGDVIEDLQESVFELARNR